MDEKKLRKIWEEMASESYLESKETGVTYKESHTLEWLEEVCLVEDEESSYDSFYDDISDSKKTLSGKTIGIEDEEDDVRPHTLSGKTGDSNQSVHVLQKSIFKGNTADYEVFEEINRGGMGKISRGVQRGLKRDIAIKEILAKNKETKTHREKFISEALVTAYLDHPNIVPVYELRENKDGEIFLAMKLIDGVSWKELLRSKDNSNNSFSDHLKILLNVCNAVAFAHSKGIAHNDLKPENIMVGKFGEVFVMDWGIAVDIGSNVEQKRTLHKSQINKPMGTPCYMPIELAEGQGNDIGAWTDVYLLGATLYEIVTGKPPHAAETVWLSILSCREQETYEFPKGTSDEIKDICNISLSKDKDDRFQSVQEFQKALEGYLQHRESASISEEAKKILDKCRTTVDACIKKKIKMKEAERNRLYSEFAHSVAYFQQALMLWDGNSPAHKGELQARCSYAEFALLNGDIALAEAQAELLIVHDHSQSSSILLKVQKAKNNKLRYERRYRNLRYMLMAAIVFIIAGLTVFTFSLQEEKKRTETQTEEAARQREFAFNRRNEAINKAEEAKRAKEEVEKYAQKLEEQKKKIAEEAQQAKTTLAQIALQKASEAYDNAQWKSCGTYAGLGLELLKEFNAVDDGIENLRKQNTSFIRLALQKEGIVWKTMPGYARHINQIICIPEKNLLITAAQDREIRLWDLATGKEKFSFVGHTDTIDKIIYDEHNSVLISASRDKTIRFWSLVNLQLLDSLYCDNFEIHSLAAYHGKIAVGSNKQVVFIERYAGNSYKIAKKIELNDENVIDNLAYSSDGKCLLFGKTDLRVLEIETAKIIYASKRKEKIAIIANNIQYPNILVTGEGNTIFVWNKQNNEYHLAQKITKHDGTIEHILIQDENTILSYASDNTIFLHDLKGKSSRTVGKKENVTALSYSSNNKNLFLGTSTGVYVYNINEKQEIYDLPAHTAKITSVAFSADGHKIASASEDKSIRLWDTQTGKQIKALYGHTKKINSLSFHPNQNMLASVSDDKSVQLWDIEKNTVSVLAGHNDDITAVVCHPQKNIFASGSKDSNINIWEVPSGKQIFVLKGHTKVITSLCYNEAGTILVSGSADNKICIWQSSNGEKLFTLQGHKGIINDLVIHPNQKILASASDDQNIILWNIETGEKIRSLEEHKQPITSLLFSPDGGTLISGGKDKQIILWNLQNGQSKALKLHTAWITDLIHDNKNNYFLSASSDSNIYSWQYNGIVNKKFPHSSDISSLSFHQSKSIFASSAGTNIYIWEDNGRKILDLKGHTSWIKSVCFRPYSDELASASSDKRVLIWNAVMGRKIKELTEHESDVNKVVYTADGKYLISASKKTIIIWDADSKTMSSQILSGHTQKINDVAFSPDQKTLASVASDNSLRIWDIETQKVIQVLQGHNSEINAVDYSPKGKFIATASSDKTIRVWDLERGKTIFVLFGHEGEVKDIAYNPSGNAIATSSTDNTIKVWNIATGKPTLTLENMRGVESVKYSKDGRILTIALLNNDIELWDIATAKRIDVLTGHTSSVLDIAYSPDGKKIVSGSHDQTIRLWNIPNSINVSLLKGHDYQNIRNIAYHSQKQVFASVGDDRKVYLWDHNNPKPLAISKEQKSHLYSVCFNPVVKEIVCGNSQGEIIILNDTLDSLYSFYAHSSPISEIRYNTDASILATCSQDNAIYFWKLKRQENKFAHKKVSSLEKHDAKVTSICFSPDGTILVSGSEDKTIRVWDVASTEQKFILSRHKAEVNQVTISPNNLWIASASNDQTVRIWDAKKGTPVYILQGHSQPVLSVSFSSDNSYLLSSSQDGTIIMWDVSTGKMISHFSMYNTVATRLVYHPNDIGFVSISPDKIIRFWSFEHDQAKPDNSTLPVWFKAMLPLQKEQIIPRSSAFDVRSDIPGYLLEYAIMKAPGKVTESLFDSGTTSTFGITNQVPYTLFEKQ